MTDKKVSKSERVDKSEIINYRGVSTFIPSTETLIRMEADMYTVLREVREERAKQNQKWGRQYHTNDDWRSITGEEIGEIDQALNFMKFGGKDTDAQNLYEEIIQSAACLVAWAEQLKREQEGVDIFGQTGRTNGKTE